MKKRSFIQTYIGIQDEELLQQLTDMSYVRSVEPGERPVLAGMRLQELPFLMSGCVRAFYVGPTEEEFTDLFTNTPGWPIVTPDLSRPQEVNVEALVPTKLLYIPIVPMMELVNSNIEAMRAYMNILQWAMVTHWEAKVLRYRFTAAQRYQWFLETYPELEDVVSSRIIASLLGISPVTLSRLRRQHRDHPEEFSNPLPSLHSY